MSFEKIMLNNTTSLNIIQTNQFKNIAIMVTMKGIVEKEKASAYALLARMLPKATKEFPSMNGLSTALDARYGGSLAASSSHYGNMNLFHFYCMFIDDSYLLRPCGLLKEQFRMLHEIIYNPLGQNGKFDEAYFEERKNNYIQSLMALQNNKEYQASVGIKTLFAQDHPVSVLSNGYLEDAKALSNEQTYQIYQELLQRPFDIYVLGDVDRQEIVNLIQEYLVINEPNEPVELKPIDPYPVDEYQEQIQPMPFKQSQLLQAYTVDVDATNQKNLFTSLVFNAIFGGGMGSSKLYNNLREEHGLCYSVYSQYNMTNQILYVSAGIQANNYQLALDLIQEELKNMQSGKITEEEFERAKSIYRSVVRAQFDSIDMTISYYEKNNLNNRTMTLEEYEQGIMDVTLAEVQELANHVQLSKQYFVQESKGGEDDEEGEF